MSLFARLLLTITFATFVTACASPTVVQSVKPGDTGLSCAQLQNEFADAERYRAEADKEKSVTGGNVVRAIFFWPAILGTASNANEAIAAADSRKVHLANQMNQKNCALATSNQAAAKPAQTKEEQLSELRKLYESNLVSKEAYEDRQKTILNGPSL